MSVCVGPYGGQKTALEFPDDEATDGYVLLTWVLGTKLRSSWKRTKNSSFICLVLFDCFLFVCLLFKDRVSLCNPGCPGTYSVG